MKYIRGGTGGNDGGRKIFLDQTGRRVLNTFERAGGTEHFLTKRGRGITFFSQLWSKKISNFLSMRITDQSFSIAGTAPTKFKA